MKNMKSDKLVDMLTREGISYRRLNGYIRKQVVYLDCDNFEEWNLRKMQEDLKKIADFPSSLDRQEGLIEQLIRGIEETRKYPEYASASRESRREMIMCALMLITAASTGSIAQ